MTITIPAPKYQSGQEVCHPNQRGSHIWLIIDDVESYTYYPKSKWSHWSYLTQEGIIREEFLTTIDSAFKVGDWVLWQGSKFQIEETVWSYDLQMWMYRLAGKSEDILESELTTDDKESDQ